MSRGPSPEGDDACWLDRVCEGCGRIPDDGGGVDDGLDDEGRCASCRRSVRG